MATLLERVTASIEQSHRSAFDVVRTLALFVPEEHTLARSVHKCLDSMEFAAPECHSVYMMVLLADMATEYPTEMDVEAAPWWVRVVLIILLGGKDDLGATTDLLKSLEGSGAANAALRAVASWNENPTLEPGLPPELAEMVSLALGNAR